MAPIVFSPWTTQNQNLHSIYSSHHCLPDFLIPIKKQWTWRQIVFFTYPGLSAGSFPHRSFFLPDSFGPSMFFCGIYQCFVICLPRTAQLRWSIWFSARSCFCYPIFQLDWQRHKEVKWPARVRWCRWLGTDWSLRSSWLCTLHWATLPFTSCSVLEINCVHFSFLSTVSTYIVKPPIRFISIVVPPLNMGLGYFEVIKIYITMHTDLFFPCPFFLSLHQLQ